MIVASTFVCDLCGSGYSGVDTARVYTASAYGMMESADLCTDCLKRVRDAIQTMKDEHVIGASVANENDTETE